jgi:pullulanase
MLDGTVKHGRCYRIDLTTSETKAVQSGKKLGLIMVRTFVDELGYVTPFWNGNKGKDLNSDRYLDLKSYKIEGTTNQYAVWIIAGDKNNYTSLRDARLAFERVESANLIDFDTMIVQTSKPVLPSADIAIYKVPDGSSYSDPVNKEVNRELCGVTHINVNKYLPNDKNWSTPVAVEGENGTEYGYTRFALTGISSVIGNFGWNVDYQILINDVSPFCTYVNKTRLYLSKEFKEQCELPADASVRLGATYSPEGTTFRVWAPISTAVYLNLYRTGDELADDRMTTPIRMTRGDKGIWETTVTSVEVDGVKKDLDGVYYTYRNYVMGEEYETVDVYATAVGVNGNRAMVCNLAATDPDGWDSDLAAAATIRTTKCDSGVIWEVHVRDFSISPDSGLTYKGKYLAFTEQDTKVKGSDTLSSGIAYLKELGISYVHLNPVFDFATVDEQYINNTDYTTKQNWGYDPKNYNVPEGSYATDAENGAVRINEFKRMVQALHDAGIGVIMDVVYNHTATSDSFFEHTVPGYYYRQSYQYWDNANDVLVDAGTGTFGYKDWFVDSLGNYALSDGSGCSNETASERAMFRRYMVESLTYWASEYHIDGFRFDLMAIHDVATMNAIRASLNGLDGGEGILLYGEPWDAAYGLLGLDPEYNNGANGNNVYYVEHSGDSANTNSLCNMPDIKAFNDRVREGIKGNNGGGTGYVQGNTGEDTLNRVKAGINGYFAGTESAGNNHAITYTTSHDNYTLWDQLINTTVKQKSPTIYTEPNKVLIRKNMMAATLTLTSRGMAFILAGEEIGRTKYGNHNSYNAQDKINAFDYNRQKEFDALLDWYKGLIRLRTAYSWFAKGNTEAYIYDAGNGCIGYIFKNESGTEPYTEVHILLNPNGAKYTTTHEAVSDAWHVLADAEGFHDLDANGNSLSIDSLTTVGNGSVEIPAYGTLILVK